MIRAKEINSTWQNKKWHQSSLHKSLATTVILKNKQRIQQVILLTNIPAYNERNWLDKECFLLPTANEYNSMYMLT